MSLAGLYASADILIAAVEAHDRLYRPYLKQPPGLLICAEANPLTKTIVVQLVDIDAAGAICNVHGRTELSEGEAERAAARIVESGAEWALEMWSAVSDVARDRWRVAS